MTSASDDQRGRRTGLLWGVAGMCLAVAATVVLVFSDDMRWLRLGIVAALWATLLGWLLASRYRKQAERAVESEDDAKRLYELELEREIAARREYELGLETELRSELAASARGDLDALRDEVIKLRDTLHQIVGGSVLYERVALTAQSTRMRSLPEDKPVAPAQQALPGGAASGAEGSYPVGPRDAGQDRWGGQGWFDELSEQRTELITRLIGHEMTTKAADPPPPRSARHGRTPELLPARETAKPDDARDVDRPRYTAPAAAADLSRDLSGDMDIDLGWTPSWEQESAREAPVTNGSQPASGTDDGSRWNTTLPDEALQIQRSGKPGGRRRKPEHDAADVHPLPSTNGSHAVAAGEPEYATADGERGSHAAGRSVSDLLAAYGGTPEPRRHRRREP